MYAQILCGADSSYAFSIVALNFASESIRFFCPAFLAGHIASESPSIVPPFA